MQRQMAPSGCSQAYMQAHFKLKRAQLVQSIVVVVVVDDVFWDIRLKAAETNACETFQCPSQTAGGDKR